MGLPPNCAAGCRSSSATGKMTKPIIVDARAHMLGRLASIVAKQLLNGEHVVCVRTEEITLSGGLVRQRMKYERFLRKRHNTNPVKGPYHFRAPASFEDHPRNGAPEDQAWPGCPGPPQVLRGHPRPLRHPEAHGRSRGPQGPAPRRRPQERLPRRPLLLRWLEARRDRQGARGGP